MSSMMLNRKLSNLITKSLRWRTLMIDSYEIYRTSVIGCSKWLMIMQGCQVVLALEMMIRQGLMSLPDKYKTCSSRRNGWSEIICSERKT